MSFLDGASAARMASACVEGLPWFPLRADWAGPPLDPQPAIRRPTIPMRMSFDMVKGREREMWVRFHEAKKEGYRQANKTPLTCD
jgi:hypothetical protein